MTLRRRMDRAQEFCVAHIFPVEGSLQPNRLCASGRCAHHIDPIPGSLDAGCLGLLWIVAQSGKGLEACPSRSSDVGDFTRNVSSRGSSVGKVDVGTGDPAKADMG